MLSIDIKTNITPEELLTTTDEVLTALFGTMSRVFDTISEDQDAYFKVRAGGMRIQLAPSGISLHCDPDKEHLCLIVPENIFQAATSDAVLNEKLKAHWQQLKQSGFPFSFEDVIIQLRQKQKVEKKEKAIMSVDFKTQDDPLETLFSSNVNIGNIINKINWKDTMAAINQDNLPIIPLAQFIFKDSHGQETGTKAIFNYSDNKLTFIMPQAIFDGTPRKEHSLNIQNIGGQLHGLSEFLLANNAIEEPLTFVVRGDNPQKSQKQIVVNTSASLSSTQPAPAPAPAPQTMWSFFSSLVSSSDRSARTETHHEGASCQQEDHQVSSGATI